MGVRSGTTLRSCISVNMGDNINIKELLQPLEESLKEIQISLQTNIDKINTSITQIKAIFDEKLKLQEFLDFAIDETSISDNLYVDYIFADKYCKLKLESKTGR